MEVIVGKPVSAGMNTFTQGYLRLRLGACAGRD